MINLVYDGQKEIKEKEGKFLIATLDKNMYETDSFKEMAAVICGKEYLDCDSAETEMHLRINAAKNIGLWVMTAEEIENGLLDTEEDENAGFEESIIIYDERIGKIPYSYTDPVVDYDIHGDPQLIRVECDETFIYSLEKNRLIAAWEKVDGEYQRFLQTKDLDALIEKELVSFKEAAEKQGRVPLHKKLGE
ncbi:hypothetical protein [Anaerovorax sp. IOR16]|uniref:hypothetical protein n=1 Tax=Anaerovorax sp. IOR16 TaxID=2773458 RepID=UPI0019D080EC|nr:hypothetical protein [Anaerovorax sp. IOR16]